MPKPRRPWIVTRHDPIKKLEDNLWAVEGDVPGLGVKRWMFIIKLSDGSLMFVGAAVPLEDAALAEVTAWGRPSLLIVAHDQHMIDAHAFAEKLGLKVYGPKECEVKMRARAEIAGTLDAVSRDASVQIEPVAGTKMGEPAIIVKSAGGTRVSILFADVIQNTPKESLGAFLKLLGFGGGPKIVPVFKMMFLKDKKALAGQLSRWAEIPGLVRLAPCHGDAVTTDAAAALRGLASDLRR